MASYYPTASRNAACDAVVNLLDGGTLVGYDGTRPADADTALSGNNVLVTITLPSPATDAAGTTSAGVATKSGTWSATASATGTLTFFRAFTSGAAIVAQYTANVSGGEAGGADPDVIMSRISIVSGETVTVNSATFTVPNTP